ncbi:related to integral membrane protein [Cephalotrichum gorgonifer]|uniref:Related to integral membrane protein n=1 Tax=Cephalotrichum gorgonifer TaxID=2041049 RepID=A0AAE8N7Z9_9PEZI|nr:related to integral membrane protein [Cephalotrichum gorgonifer]
MLTFGQASESSPSVAYFFAGCIGVTLYNAVEIIVLIFATFKRYGGWYFWSLLVASIGLIVTTTGFSTYFFNITPNKFVQSAVTIAGWWAFIVGQSLVLWSRLHLVLQSPRILRGVLAMIIVNAIVLLIPTTVLSLGNNVDPIPEPFARGYDIMENIQLTVFCVQEFIISGLYIWATTKLLAYTTERRKRRLMAELITMNVVLVLMDLVLIGVQYASFRILQIVLKGFVFSIKLKFELAVLGRLTAFVHAEQALILGMDASGIADPVHQRSSHHTGIGPRSRTSSSQA